PLLEHAGRLGSRRMLLLGVFLAQRLLGASLPHNLQQPLRADSTIPGLAEDVTKNLFTNTSQSLFAVNRPLFYVRLRDRLRHRLLCGGYLVYHKITSRFCNSLRPGATQNIRKETASLTVTVPDESTPKSTRFG